MISGQIRSWTFPLYNCGELMITSSYFYVQWLPSYISSGTFRMANRDYDFSSYSSGFFSGTSVFIDYYSSLGVIWSSAFISNSKITEIQTNVNGLQWSAFKDCSKLTRFVGYALTWTEDYGFYNCSRLSEVIAPNLSIINYRTFAQCDSLTQVNFPECSWIGDEVFLGCESLVSAYLPNCVSLYPSAFSGCSLLSDVNLSKCRLLQPGAFKRCTSLSYLELPSASDIRDSVFWNASKFEFISLPGSSVCLLSTSNAFGGTKITQRTGIILVPTSLLSEYKVAPEWSYFWNNPYSPRMRALYCIDDMTMWWTPQSARGTYVSLQDIHTYESSIQSFHGYMPSNYYYGSGYNGFLGINYGRFSTLHVNASILTEYFNCSINEAYFEECEKITGESCFAGADIKYISLPICSLISPDYVFKNNTFSEIELPECGTIGHGTFSSCINLERVSLPKLKIIGSRAFWHCSKLSEIDLPSCTSIGIAAFQGCSALKRVSIPKCYYIKENTFLACILLSEIDFPDCSYVSSTAFEGCYALSRVSLPKCKWIQSWAFKGCSSLSEIVLPSCLELDGNAFNNCVLLSKIVLGSTTMCSLINTTGPHFNNTLIASGIGGIYVRSSLVTTYKNNSQWSVWASQIFPISS